MNILIYGAGAVGLGLSSCLIKSGQQVDVITRKKTRTALRNNGLMRSGIFGEFFAPSSSFRAFSGLDELTETHYDVILVCTKSFDTAASAVDLARHLHIFKKDTVIVLCQNGWGNAEIFAEYFSKKYIYNARIITGFIRPYPHEVKITVHADTIRVGSLFHKRTHDIKELCSSLAKGGIPCAPTNTIGKDLWAKMLYNCALNPLGAILGVPYGTLGEFSYSRNLMENIIREIFIVMRKSGFHSHWKTPEKYIEKFYNHFLPSTAKHSSSTLQDLRSKRKTEIEALNGMVIRMAKRLNLSVPTNETVYRMVKMIEEENLKKKPAIPALRS